MFKAFRIAVLLFILATVAQSAWLARTRSVEWKYVLPVNLYLINGDGSPVTAEYLRGLSADDFKPIEGFMRAEAARYGLTANASIDVRLAGHIVAHPPAPPRNGSKLDVVIWSLQMRWWVYRNTDTVGPGPQIKMFLLYFDPARNKRLDHSTGLQKGLIGRVNLFANDKMTSQNSVVVAHEFLHTLGATDKYDLSTLQPHFPDGYAEPELVPPYPQRFAEIMAGRTPLSRAEASMPSGLDSVLIGYKTAQEINWR